jgi:hypothetical protein
VNFICGSKGQTMRLFRSTGTETLIGAVQDYLDSLAGENTLDATTKGNDNAVDIRQFGKNDITLTVTGDGNNTARAFPSALAALGLAPGTIEQTGFGNQFDAIVTGDSNSFRWAATWRFKHHVPHNYWR